MQNLTEHYLLTLTSRKTFLKCLCVVSTLHTVYEGSKEQVPAAGGISDGWVLFTCKRQAGPAGLYLGLL